MKYELKEFHKKDGTTIWIVYENEGTTSKGGFIFNMKREIFSGTKAECEEKLKELENRK